MKDISPVQSWAADVLAFHCPRWAELPGIALYMDQLTGYINEVFSPLAVPGAQDALFTKAMVNNYVKQQVVQRPENKKYGKEQLATLIALCVMKQVFSIPEIAALLRGGLERYPVQAAYDYFCVELENALRAAFQAPDVAQKPDTAQTPTELSLLARRIVLAFASKVYVQKRIACASNTEEGLSLPPEGQS